MGGKRTTTNPNAGVLGGRRTNHGKLGKLPEDDGSAPRFVERTARATPSPRGDGARPLVAPELDPIVFFHGDKMRFARELRAMAASIGASVDSNASQKALALAITRKLRKDESGREACLEAIARVA